MRALGTMVVALSLIASVACQGGTGDGGGGGAADARTAGVDAAAGDVALTCNAGDVPFPALSRSCRETSDCAIAFHQIDCCGSSVATGIAASDSAAFEEAEAECAALFPGCGCASLPPVLDDGTSARNLQSIEVVCSELGSCATSNVELPGG